MRTRLLTAVTAAILAVPLATTAASASPDEKCEQSTSVQHKCDPAKG